jgi:hypothetical protein
MLRNEIFNQEEEEEEEEEEAPIDSTKGRQGINLDQPRKDDDLILPKNRGNIIVAMKHQQRHKRGAKPDFPITLHKLLRHTQRLGMEHIVSWLPHGRAFAVHDRKAFENEVIPVYFHQSRFSSFQRQLNKYGFACVKHPGPDQGAYYHQFFLRGRQDLCVKIVRGQNARMEPDFSKMPPVGLTNEEEVGAKKTKQNNCQLHQMDPRSRSFNYFECVACSRSGHQT